MFTDLDSKHEVSDVTKVNEASLKPIRSHNKEKGGKRAYQRAGLCDLMSEHTTKELTTYSGLVNHPGLTMTPFSALLSRRCRICSCRREGEGGLMSLSEA